MWLTYDVQISRELRHPHLNKACLVPDILQIITDLSWSACNWGFTERWAGTGSLLDYAYPTDHPTCHLVASSTAVEKCTGMIFVGSIRQDQALSLFLLLSGCHEKEILRETENSQASTKSAPATRQQAL